MQRDCLRIARVCQARGHTIRVYTLEWQGVVPSGCEVDCVPVKGLNNHRRYGKFSAGVHQDLTRRPADRIVGCDKMPGLDVY